MKIRHIILLSAIVIGVSSCSTIRKSTVSTVDVETSVLQYPTVADLDVMNKVEKSITWTFNPLKFEKLSQIKTNLMADLLKEAGADVLLEPQYTFTKVSYGERTLTITGFPAKFKNFRKANADDIHALNAVYSDPTETPVYNVAQNCQKHKKRKLGFLGL